MSKFIDVPKSDYAATVVELDRFVDLPNCDFVKAAIIFGNSVIVSKDTEVGVRGLFFPIETALSKAFLGNNNQYRKVEDGNINPDLKGFFETSGRVKAVKFRGHKSEGFFIPFYSLSYLNLNHDELDQLKIGTTFDKLGDHEICHKYIPRGQRTGGLGNGTPKGKQAKLEDSIVDGQFRLHTDTSNFRKNSFKLSPSDFISISDKWHGTSVVISRLLVKRPLNFFERILLKLGVAIQTQKYGVVYSSRRVIKAVDGKTKQANHFYTSDIWGDVAQEVADIIPAGFTLYGEIVGWTSDGGPIQGKYPYGCAQGNHKFLPYRITSTNADGLVIELSWPQMQEFCIKYGLTMVPTFYYGRAQDLYPDIDTSNHWNENFLERLEKDYVHDQDCSHNPPKTPAEGIVIRIDRLHEAEAYKLKNYRFLEHETKELDKGEMDIETAEGLNDEIEF